MRSHPVWADTARYLRVFFSGKLGKARFLFCAALVVLIAWLVCGPERLEPGLALILVIIAWLTGSQVFAELSDLRAKSQALPLESNEDPTTKPWGITNHSIHEIRWDHVTNPDWQKDLTDFWRKHFVHGWKGMRPRFDRLLEDTSTMNFRVRTMLEEIRFLRFHKDPPNREIECRRILAEWLKKAEVFDKDVADWLLPLPLKSQASSQEVLGSSLAPASRLIGEVFPYARNVTHFPGCNTNEVASVGKVLGKVQQALQELDKKTRSRLSPLTSLCRNRLLEAEELGNSWKEIQRLLGRATLSHPFARLLIVDKECAVKDWVDEAKRVRCSSQDQEFMLLHDVHPHNVFFRDGECVLIYDYQWLGMWPHGHVVAFALHRFVRELMVKPEDTSSGNKSLVEGASRFLGAYQKSCDLPLPEKFAENLQVYIRSSNMDKLLNTFKYGLSGYDPLQRTEARLLGEARKFIRYMKEADKFAIAQSTPPSPSSSQRSQS